MTLAKRRIQETNATNSDEKDESSSSSQDENKPLLKKSQKQQHLEPQSKRKAFISQGGDHHQDQENEVQDDDTFKSFKEKQASRPQKRLSIAYLCWFFGGLFGLHHFYLGRDNHAFITFATFGGYFSLGLIRDLWRLPEYVKDANNDLDYLDNLYAKIKTHKRPPSSMVRQSGIMIMGNLFAYLVEYAIPQELLSDNIVLLLRFLLIPLASAVGVWLTGNVGRHKGSIKMPLVASYLSAIPSILIGINHASFSTLASMMVFNRYSKEWDLDVHKRRKSLPKRMFTMTTCVIIYIALWSSWGYFSCSIEDPETLEPIKCRVAMANFLKSSAYNNLSEAIYMLWDHVRNQGFIGLWRELVQEFDMSGRSSALAVLDLEDDATPEQILTQYKKLSREYHPDRAKDERKKAEMHEKFIELQEAYRLLKPNIRRYPMQDESRQHQHPNEHDEL